MKGLFSCASNLRALCDFCDGTADYLLGEDVLPGRSLDAAAAARYTGLSLDVVEYLHLKCGDEPAASRTRSSRWVICLGPETLDLLRALHQDRQAKQSPGGFSPEGTPPNP